MPDIINLASNSTLNGVINEDQNEIPSITNLAMNVSLNAKIKDVKGKIPSITNLATNAALTTVENKIPNVSDLVKKADYDAEILDIKNKYFTTSDYNKFANNILNWRITAKKLVNQSGLNEKIKILATKEKIKN